MAKCLGFSGGVGVILAATLFICSAKLGLDEDTARDMFAGGTILCMISAWALVVSCVVADEHNMDRHFYVRVPTEERPPLAASQRESRASHKTRGYPRT